jgi:hypothetical protein
MGACATGAREKDVERSSLRERTKSGAKARSERSTLRAAAAELGVGGTDIATVSTTRWISLKSIVATVPKNRDAKSVAGPVGILEPEVRRCYEDRLDEKPGLRGSLKLGFQINPVDGSWQKLSRVGGSIKDAGLVRCVRKTLARVAPLTVARDVSGTVVYHFDVLAGNQTTVAGAGTQER